MKAKPALLFLFASSGFALASVTAAWQTKNFRDWTDNDAQQIMRDSPWAKRIPMPAAGRPGMVTIEPGANGAPPPTAALGNSSNTTTGTNMTVAANAGSAGGADPTGQHTLSTTQTPSGMTPSDGAPSVEPPLTIIWASAVPIRLAVLKLRSAGQPISDEQVAKAEAQRPNYVIAVVGLPAPDPMRDPQELAKDAFLSVKGKTAAMATRSDYRKIGASDVYFFHFPKANLPVSSVDQQAEFKMRMGSIEIKKKFDLKEMRYQGQPAL
jgi:hypothetical protein